MADAKQENQTFLTEFILLGFGNIPNLRIFLFLFFALIYFVTITANILIILLVVIDQHLHTPMFYLLGNLSCLEICYTSNILPRMLVNFLTKENRISFNSCFLQFYFFASLACAECYLLSAMSYDRYIAICKPLHYTMLMSVRSCLLLAGGSWLCGFLASICTTLYASWLTFCGPNEIDHFFCDYTPLLVLSCSETRETESVMSILASACTMPPFILTLVSYICIITAILKIPSSIGRQKAFSTCSSHLIVVILFYGTLIVVYTLPKTKALRELNKILSVFYTILTPMLNPLIYSLRNEKFKEALRKAISKYIH
ncbi:olfactory receptor 5V1-like [Phaenicophaeus curvirostris]|uniref:olfactory receptor 5V1-like n=1 Tax=Phaenicophaeus curvirostris TaxID=33595 RepID=UPI0037F0B942